VGVGDEGAHVIGGDGLGRGEVLLEGAVYEVGLALRGFPDQAAALEQNPVHLVSG
jgi:hypothetical protein